MGIMTSSQPPVVNRRFIFLISTMMVIIICFAAGISFYLGYKREKLAPVNKILPTAIQITQSSPTITSMPRTIQTIIIKPTDSTGEKLACNKEDNC